MPDRATMPDEFSGPDWIRLDRLVDDLGEDPGRYLDGPLDPLPRIRGLDSIPTVRAWIGAERRIASIRNRKPREDIIEALNRRETYLEGYQRSYRQGRHFEKTVLYQKRDGEVVPYDEIDRTTVLEQPKRSIATDGGEAGGE
jgi:hypothetical protein